MKRQLGILDAVEETLGLFWWELRNIRDCFWYIKLTESFEVALLGQLGVPERRPQGHPPLVVWESEKQRNSSTQR